MDTAVTLRFATQPADLSALARVLRGTLVQATDAAFDEDRQVWNAAPQGTGRHLRAVVGIKRRYDPGNVFHRNQNIRPA